MLFRVLNVPPVTNPWVSWTCLTHQMARDSIALTTSRSQRKKGNCDWKTEWNSNCDGHGDTLDGHWWLATTRHDYVSISMIARMGLPPLPAACHGKCALAFATSRPGEHVQTLAHPKRVPDGIETETARKKRWAPCSTLHPQPAAPAACSRVSARVQILPAWGSLVLWGGYDL